MKEIKGKSILVRVSEGWSYRESRLYSKVPIKLNLLKFGFRRNLGTRLASGKRVRRGGKLYFVLWFQKREKMMASDQLSYDEFIKCVNICVKVIEVQKRRKQLPNNDDAANAPDDEGFDEVDEGVEVDEGIDEELSCEETFTRGHGSGLIIDHKFVITCKHVVQDAIDDEQNTIEIRILNDAIEELPCKIVHCDVANDLALLYCESLDLKQMGICPIELSEDQLWPSISLFTFGYPLTYNGNQAILAKGFVSGVLDRLFKEPFMIINLPVNHGNSGGPVFCRVGDAIKVVGVVAQRHIKEILTSDEKEFVEKERRSERSNSQEHECKYRSITFKLYDACNETHCQFNYGNAIPARLVSKFIADAKKKFESVKN